MSGLSYEESERLKILQREYNLRHSNMIAILEAQMNNSTIVKQKVIPETEYK